MEKNNLLSQFTTEELQKLAAAKSADELSQIARLLKNTTGGIY